MPIVQIKPNTGSHTQVENGNLARYEAGDVLTVTEAVYQAFKDKFDLVDQATTTEEQAEPQEPFDVDQATITEVLAAVEAGQITADEALAAEKQGKNRLTLVNQLEDLSGGGA